MGNRFKQAAEYQQNQINKKEVENKHENIEQKVEQEETGKNLSLKNILSNIENKEVSFNLHFI